MTKNIFTAECAAPVVPNCLVARKPFAKSATQVRRCLMGMSCILIILFGITNGLSDDLNSHSKDNEASILNRQMLAAHNAVRTKLKLPLLQWSNELTASSQKWANTLLAENRFDINPETPYGQNLFMIAGGSASPAAVVWNWASESQNFDYESNTCIGICGHYTQLVWRSTARVGCAVARGSKREVWVCDYDPPGNVSGRLPY